MMNTDQNSNSDSESNSDSNSNSIFNSRYLLPMVFLSSIVGGIVYGLTVMFFETFNPLFSVLAGFIGCLGILILETYYVKNGLSSRDTAPVSTMIFYSIFGMFALYIGFAFLYVFMKVGIGLDIRPIDVLSFNMFVSGSLGAIDIIMAFVGILLAYIIPFFTSSNHG